MEMADDHDRLRDHVHEVARDVASLRGRHEALLEQVDEAIAAIRETLSALSDESRDLRDGRSRHDEQIRTLFRIVDQLETIVRGDSQSPGLSGEVVRIRERVERPSGLQALIEAVLQWFGLK